MLKNALTTDNANILDISMLFAYVLNETISNDYFAIVDSQEKNSRSFKDDYIHVYRHDTRQANAKANSNNVFKCYLKRKKHTVNIKCNAHNFETFSSDIQYIKERDNAEYRYIVSFDDFISFMHELIAYDTNRQTTTANKENALQIAK